jgi:hypothetical protein
MCEPTQESLDYESQQRRQSWLKRTMPAAETIALPLAIIGSAFALWADRLPVVDIELVFVGFICMAVACGCWLTMVNRNFKDQRLRARTVIVIPSIMLLTIALLSSGWLPIAAFFLQRPALDKWAKTWLANPNSPTAARVGAYEIYDIDRFSGGLRGYLKDSNTGLVEGGLVYSPTTAPVSEEPETYTPITGGWYFLYNDN